MGVEEINAQVERNRRALGDDVHVPLNGQTRDELALLSAVLGNDADDVVRRAVHEYLRALLREQVFDAHLRRRYGVTYDEYIAGMEMEEMMGGAEVRETTTGAGFCDTGGGTRIFKTGVDNVTVWKKRVGLRRHGHFSRVSQLSQEPYW